MEIPNNIPSTSIQEKEVSTKKDWIKPEAKSVEINYVGYSVREGIVAALAS